jgi:hypothetical protein
MAGLLAPRSAADEPDAARLPAEATSLRLLDRRQGPQYLGSLVRDPRVLVPDDLEDLH